nr:PRD domain-containing protein [uncultured Mediterraneibacter sp.]
MYRITKVLNHNAILAVEGQGISEFLLLGKGVGFGKKVTQTVEVPEGTAIYSLQENTQRGSAKDLIKEVDPKCLEIADAILNEAEKKLGKLDRTVLFPMADHLAFAIRRIQNGEQIHNPLANDIRILFHQEYKAAQCADELLKKEYGIQIVPDEIGYLALHVHSAITEEKISDGMLTAQAVHYCVELLEQETGQSIDVMSLAYNRLMNHVRYMIARAIQGEKLKLNMNDYMSVKFPRGYALAEQICREIEKTLHKTIEEVEIGYLAMHLERIASEELEEG